MRAIGAAELLASLYHSRRRLAFFPPELSPRTVKEAWDIVDALQHVRSEPVGGWKAGPNFEGDRLAGPVFASDLIGNGEVLALPRGSDIRVEPEIGLLLGGDLPSDGARFDRVAVANYVDRVLPVFEVMDSRLHDNLGAPTLTRFVESLGCRHLVLGDGVPAGAVDFGASIVRLSVDGRLKAPDEHLTPPDPLAVLCELANSAIMRGRLKRGAVVMTGTWMKAISPASGERIQAEFTGIGTVTVRFLT